jgi:hypothetical protein
MKIPMDVLLYMAILAKLAEAWQEATDGDSDPGDVQFTVRHKSLPAGHHLECEFKAQLVKD